jgi:hypothetical protein
VGLDTIKSSNGANNTVCYKSVWWEISSFSICNVIYSMHAPINTRTCILVQTKLHSFESNS